MDTIDLIITHLSSPIFMISAPWQPLLPQSLQRQRPFLLLADWPSPVTRKHQLHTPGDQHIQHQQDGHFVRYMLIQPQTMNKPKVLFSTKKLWQSVRYGCCFHFPSRKEIHNYNSYHISASPELLLLP